MKFLCNAFSAQMIKDYPATVTFKEVEKPASFEGYQSAIGHPDTAAVLGVACNRINVSLNKGDVILIAQLQGGRLPEGCKTLPEGFSFKWLEATVS